MKIKPARFGQHSTSGILKPMRLFGHAIQQQPTSHMSMDMFYQMILWSIVHQKPRRLLKLLYIINRHSHVKSEPTISSKLLDFKNVFGREVRSIGVERRPQIHPY